jgi:hypothetical protein
MQERKANMKYGGALVYPGGRVDKSDLEHTENELIAACRLAAIR